ncbi:MAG: hypothetical protein L3J47_06950 [Sulfurovum sp.]|nr:hypothetical protein [Sulfurovum sp.]
MRGETQASHLETMMRKQGALQTYELALAPVRIGYDDLKRLQKDDLVSLQSGKPALFLLDKDEIVATVGLDLWKRMAEVISLKKRKHKKHGKYEILLCSFGEVNSSRLLKGKRIDVSALDLSRVTLKTKEKIWAYGTLVWTNEHVAVKILKVEK